MKKGVVVEYNDDFVTLLTPDGQFIKTKNNEGKYEIGTEISFFSILDNREEAATRTQYKKRFITDLLNLRVGVITVAAIMIFMFSFIPFFNDEKVYAYMSIDINPSFEIGINDELNVISLDPLNEEAVKLFEELPDWKNKPFDEIVDTIINKSKMDGFIYPGKEIVITTVIDEEEKDVQSKLDEGMGEIRSTYENNDMVVKTIESNVETREKALKQGISTGKYLQLQEKEKPSEDQKEKVTEPDEKLEETEKQEEIEKSTTSSNQISSVPAMVNPQPVKEQLKTDTKENLQETKKKIQEKTNKTNNHVKQELKQQKQQNKGKKEKEQKKNNNKQKNNDNKGDRDENDRNDKKSNQKDWHDDNRDDDDDQDDNDENRESNWNNHSNDFNDRN